MVKVVRQYDEAGDNPDPDEIIVFSVRADVTGELSLCQGILNAVEKRVREEAPRREPGYPESDLRAAITNATSELDGGRPAQAREILDAVITRIDDDIPF